METLDVAHGSEDIGEVNAGVLVGIDVLADKCDLLDTQADQVADFAYDRPPRLASLPASHIGHDAV